jgi:uncharacterized protein YkvS
MSNYNGITGWKRAVAIIGIVVFFVAALPFLGSIRDARALGDNLPYDKIWSLIGDEIVTMDANLSTLDTALTAIELDANSIITQLTALEATADALELDANSVITQITALEATADALELDANSIITQLTALEATADALELDANSVITNLVALELDANSVITQLTALEATFDAVELDANSVITQLTALEATFDAVELDANSVITQLTALEATADALELDANSVITNLVALELDANSVITQLTALEATADALELDANTIITQLTSVATDLTAGGDVVNALNNIADYAVDQANECWFLGTAGVDWRCEGDSADGNETTFDVRDPGQDNTITVPDEGGVMMLGGKLDIGHHLVSSATPVAGSTLVYTMEDTGGMVEVVCGGTSSGTTDAHILTVLGGTTVVQTLTSAAADDGEWHASVMFGTDDGGTIDSTGQMLFETYAGGGTTLPVEYSATVLDTSEVTTWTVNITTSTNDDFSLEYCFWKILY